MKLECFRTKREASLALAARIGACIRATLRENSFFSLVVAGGSTPIDLYDVLSSAPYRDGIAWNKVHIFFGDERCVVPDHPESNYSMVRNHLLSKLPIVDDHIHRIRGEHHPALEAERYQDHIKNVLRRISPAGPRFTFVLLGLGGDGHTASLFPGDGALSSRELVAAVVPPQAVTPAVPRITLTLHGLDLAEQICFLVHGQEKNNIVCQVLKDKAGYYPAAMMRNLEQTWYLSGMDCTSLKSLI